MPYQIDGLIMVLLLEGQDHVLDVIAAVFVARYIVVPVAVELVIGEVNFDNRVDGMGGNSSVEGYLTMRINIS